MPIHHHFLIYFRNNPAKCYNFIYDKKQKRKLNIQRPKVANIMDDKKFELRPYYKSRNLEDKKIQFNQRFPKPIVDDLKQFFKDNQWNQTDGMTYLALEFLNNHCFERKSFNYTAVFITFKDHELKPDDFMLLGVSDGYGIIKEMQDKINLGEKTDDERMKHQPESEYLPIVKINKLDKLMLLLMDGDIGFKQFLFHSHVVDEKMDDKKSLFKFLETKYGRSLDDFYCFEFNLNNFLDVKSGGIYKGLSKFKYDDIHQGIQILQDNDGKNYYVTYSWHLVLRPLSIGVQMHNLQWYSKDEFFGIVTDSTNQELKNFINKQDEFKEIRKDNVLKEIEDIDNQIRELQKQKAKCKDIISNIFDDNTLINKIE